MDNSPNKIIYIIVYRIYRMSQNEAKFSVQFYHDDDSRISAHSYISI